MCGRPVYFGNTATLEKKHIIPHLHRYLPSEKRQGNKTSENDHPENVEEQQKRNPEIPASKHSRQKKSPKIEEENISINLIA